MQWGITGNMTNNEKREKSNKPNQETMAIGTVAEVFMTMTC